MSCNCTLITALVLLCVGTFMTYVATITVYWAWLEDPILGYELIRFGLYRFCIDFTNKGSHCADIQDPKDYLIAARVLDNIGNILALLSTILTFIHGYKLSKRSPSKALVGCIVGFGVAAVVLHITAVIVYGTGYEDDIGEKYDLGTSFYLQIFGGIILLVGALVVIPTYKNALVDRSAVGVVHGHHGNTIIIAQYPPGHPMTVPPGQPPQPYPGMQPAPAYPTGYGGGFAHPPGTAPPMPPPAYNNSYGTQPQYPPPPFSSGGGAGSNYNQAYSYSEVSSSTTTHTAGASNPAPPPQAKY